MGEAALQQFGSPTTVSIRLPMPASTDEGATNRLVRTVQDDLSKRYPGVAFNRADVERYLREVTFAPVERGL